MASKLQVLLDDWPVIPETVALEHPQIVVLEPSPSSGLVVESGIPLDSIVTISPQTLDSNSTIILGGTITLQGMARILLPLTTAGPQIEAGTPVRMLPTGHVDACWTSDHVPMGVMGENGQGVIVTGIAPIPSIIQAYPVYLPGNEIRLDGGYLYADVNGTRQGRRIGMIMNATHFLLNIE